MSDLGYEDPELKEYMDKLFVSVRDYDTDSFESLISEIRARL